MTEALDGQKQGVHELHLLPSSAQRHDHMGAAEGGVPHWKWDENSCSISCGAAKQGRNPDVKNTHDKIPGSLVCYLQMVEQSLCRERGVQWGCPVKVWLAGAVLVFLWAQWGCRDPASASPAALRAVEMVERSVSHPLGKISNLQRDGVGRTCWSIAAVTQQGSEKEE